MTRIISVLILINILIGCGTDDSSGSEDVVTEPVIETPPPSLEGIWITQSINSECAIFLVIEEGTAKSGSVCGPEPYLMSYFTFSFEKDEDSLAGDVTEDECVPDNVGDRISLKYKFLDTGDLQINSKVFIKATKFPDATFTCP